MHDWNDLLASFFSEFGLRLISDAHFLWANDDFILTAHVNDLALAYCKNSPLASFKQVFEACDCIMNDLG